MATHSVADAKNHLPSLIDDAIQGREVVISRYGVPVVTLRPIRQSNPITDDDVAWIARNRVAGTPKESAGDLLRTMRDEW